MNDSDKPGPMKLPLDTNNAPRVVFRVKRPQQVDKAQEATVETQD
jgi:hypothetical protein